MAKVKSNESKELSKGKGCLILLILLMPMVVCTAICFGGEDDNSASRSRSKARATAVKVAPQPGAVSYRPELLNAMTDYLDVQEALLGANMSRDDMRVVCVAGLKVGALILKIDANDHPDDRALSMSQPFIDLAQQVHDEMQVCLDFGIVSDADIPLVNQYLQR